jgi:hypothetical protein
MPATEPVTITREGEAVVAFFSRRGANLCFRVGFCDTRTCMMGKTSGVRTSGW